MATTDVDDALTGSTARRTTHPRPALSPRSAGSAGRPFPAQTASTTASGGDARGTRGPRSTAAALTAPYRRRLILADLAVALTVAVLTSSLQVLDPLPFVHSFVIVVVPAAWLACLALAGAYDANHAGVVFEEIRAVWRALVGALAVVCAAMVTTKMTPPLRYFWITVIGLCLGAVLTRLSASAWLARQRRAGHLMSRTLVIGRIDSASSLVRSLRAEPSQGLAPVAICAYARDKGHETPTYAADVPVVGSPYDAVAVLDYLDIQTVAVASHPDLSGVALRRLSWALAQSDVELVVAPGLLDVAGPRMTIRPSNHLSLLHIDRPEPGRVARAAKSAYDKIIAFILITLASPVLALIALAIRLDSPGPIIFKQVRVGAGGQDFTIFKFRTMVIDAEKRLTALREQSDGNTVLFKMKSDPRITKVGGLLRKYSLDELPQLFNVLNGTMSLVGPRPPLRSEVEQYEPDALRRLNARPGMTGLWQVSGRSDLSWEESVRLDLRYVDNWSPLLDLMILLRTAKAVFAGGGAY